MTGWVRFFIFLIAGLAIASCTRPRQSRLYVDSALESEIHQIRAIDNHAHPEKVVSMGEEDRDYDALPPDAIQDLALPAPFNSNSPYFVEAWQALWGYRYQDAKPEHVSGLEQLRHNVARQRGDQYPTWVLNKVDTEIMLANRVAMGRGLSADRFKWVPFVDMFLFPLNNDTAKTHDSDHKAFFANEEKLLRGYLSSAGFSKLPSSFDDYLVFVSHQLENWKSNGAVALKFELAYLRDLQISHPQKENAERVYSIYAASSEPSPEEYKILEDFVFRYIAGEAGRLQLPIHIHSSIGAGSYFHIANADPLALEPLFNDPALRRTKFVLLHGSWPFTREAAGLILKPNVYVDFSALMYLTYPVQAADAIRLYLEAAPQHVLYATDAAPLITNIGWEETAWIGSRNGRLALGIALTNMEQDNEITPDRAKEIAHMVMRENARALYGF